MWHPEDYQWADWKIQELVFSPAFQVSQVRHRWPSQVILATERTARQMKIISTPVIETKDMLDNVDNVDNWMFDIEAYLSVASSPGGDPNRLLTLSARHYHNGAATSLPISRSSTNLSSLPTRPTKGLIPGSGKAVSRWSVWVRGKAVQCRFEARGRFRVGSAWWEAAACVPPAASDRRGAKSGNMVCTFPFDTSWSPDRQKTMLMGEGLPQFCLDTCACCAVTMWLMEQ